LNPRIFSVTHNSTWMIFWMTFCNSVSSMWQTAEGQCNCEWLRLYSSDNVKLVIWLYTGLGYTANTSSSHHQPQDCHTRITYGHSSRSRDRTLDMWEPRLRWIPEHSIHMSTPKLRLAQSGSATQTNTGFHCKFTPQIRNED
jgi:hypothetical protein